MMSADGINVHAIVSIVPLEVSVQSDESDGNHPCACPLCFERCKTDSLLYIHCVVAHDTDRRLDDSVVVEFIENSKLREGLFVCELCMPYEAMLIDQSSILDHLLVAHSAKEERVLQLLGGT